MNLKYIFKIIITFDFHSRSGLSGQPDRGIGCQGQIKGVKVKWPFLVSCFPSQKLLHLIRARTDLTVKMDAAGVSWFEVFSTL